MLKQIMPDLPAKTAAPEIISTPLKIAAATGNLEALKSLFELEKDPFNIYPDRHTILDLAIIGGHNECAFFIIEQIQDPHLFRLNRVGALHYAIASQNLPVIERLLENPFTNYLNTPDEAGYTPLDWAIILDRLNEVPESRMDVTMYLILNLDLRATNDKVAKICQK